MPLKKIDGKMTFCIQALLKRLKSLTKWRDLCQNELKQRSKVESTDN